MIGKTISSRYKGLHPNLVNIVYLGNIDKDLVVVTEFVDRNKALDLPLRSGDSIKICESTIAFIMRQTL